MLHKGRTLIPTISKKNGRHQVCLSVNRRKKVRTVAPMVLEAFIGPRPSPITDCCHWDGNPANNVVDNLRWDTKKANQADMRRHGRHHQINKTRCKRGHELVNPNLVVGQRGRCCRACFATHSWARHRNIAKDSEKWLAEATRRYSDIINAWGAYNGKTRTECVRDHRLAAPNLVASTPNVKSCLTCSNTRAWAYYRDINASDPRWKAEADRRYTEIMDGTKKATRGTAKIECPRKHLLRQPNLRSGVGRRCLACSGAQSWAYARDIPIDDPRWLAEADRRYTEIMS